MENLLTVRQLQDILHVDRITVYRMLSDGRLTGVKVGGQWRFREDDVDQLLATRASSSGHTAAAALPLPCIQAMQEVFAQALDVAVVATDMSGAPMTQLCNCSQFCTLILESAAGRRQCQACWADLSHHVKSTPQLYRCHAGLYYARGLIEVNGKCLGSVIAGQVAPRSAPDELDAQLRRVSHSCGIDADQLRFAYPTVHFLDEGQVQKLLRIIETMATAVCRIGYERHKLISRLDRIAAISTEQ
jgi:excisionase family DNA binding protein